MTAPAGESAYDIVERLREETSAGRHALSHGLIILCPDETRGRQISPYGAPILTPDPDALSDGTDTVRYLLDLGATVTLIATHLPETLMVPDGTVVALHPESDPEDPLIAQAMTTIASRRVANLTIPKIWVCESAEILAAAQDEGLIPRHTRVYSGMKDDISEVAQDRRVGRDSVVIDDHALMWVFAHPGWSPAGAELFTIGTLSDDMMERIAEYAPQALGLGARDADPDGPGA